MATETKTYGSTEAAVDIDHQRQAEMIYASLSRLADDIDSRGTGSEGERRAFDYILRARQAAYMVVRVLQNQTGVTPLTI